MIRQVAPLDRVSRLQTTASTDAGVVPQRLRRRALRDDVYRALLDMLLDERLRPGAALSIEGLARELGVSPTPVREALVFLEHSGLVARAALKGYRVAPRLNAGEMAQLMDARGVVELAAIRRAMDEPETLSGQLREAHERQLSATTDLVRAGAEAVPPAPTIRAYFEADLEFHLVVVRAGGNPFLGQMFDGLGAHLHRMVQAAGRGVQDWESTLSEHSRVLAAVEAGSPQLAVEAMNVHLGGVQRRALSDYRDLEELGS